MRILRVESSGEKPAVRLSEGPVPTPGASEVLIKVHAAGLTPTELVWFPTSHTASGEIRIGAIPGHEFSGTVAAIGADVPPALLEVGQEVYGMSDWFADGAMSEYCLTTSTSIAPKPARLTHEEASVVPISALTAWQALIDHAKLQRGERLLVHGGAGAVGLYAIQLGRMLGAEVVTTVSSRNIDFVRKLGVQQVIDYRASRFEDMVRDMDVVLDTVGGETLQKSWGVLKPGSGRLVTIAASSEYQVADERTKKAFFIVEIQQQQLVEIANLLDSGKLRSFVDAVVPFDQAPAAFSGQVPARNGYGKIAVNVLESKGTSLQS
jgi:NADPH:quinone reductase-like Zn-dependent oxidoreductase